MPGPSVVLSGSDGGAHLCGLLDRAVVSVQHAGADRFAVLVDRDDRRALPGQPDRADVALARGLRGKPPEQGHRAS